MKAVFLGASQESFDRVYGPKQREALQQRVDMDFRMHADLGDESLREVEAVFSTWGMLQCSEEEIREKLPRLKSVFYAAGSVQAFARPFLNCGVRVFSAWKANGTPVAQFSYAQILLALKGYFLTQKKMEEGREKAGELGSHYPGVFDAKVGLLGCGAIGTQLAQMLKPLDVEVWVFDPFLSDEREAQLGVRRAEMAEIFAECDVVSNHLANLPETVGIIRRKDLMSMKPYSTFINTGRGPQLSEADLYDMLVEDPTRCALLDVLVDEGRTDENPLSRLPNCLITPHIAGSSGFEVRRMANVMIETFDCVQNGGQPDCEVTLKMLQTMA